jgi:hypothetical protein
MKDFHHQRLKQEWLDRGIILSNDKERPGTHRITREKKSFAGIRIIRLIAEELTGLNCKNIDEEKDLRYKKGDLCELQGKYLQSDRRST